MTVLWLGKPYNRAMYVTHVQLDYGEKVPVDPPVRLADFFKEMKF